jgi:CBS domain-containing protein
MKARDVMVAPAITVGPDSSIKSVAEIFVRHRISAVPVIDPAGKLIGIISEGDLLHRAETETERRRPWWLRIFIDVDQLADEYVQARARKVSDVMTRHVVTAPPEMPLHELAALLEKHAIKRVPIVDHGHLVGIVSRANIVQAVASSGKNLEVSISDSAIRDRLLKHLQAQPWAHTSLVNVTVHGGVVDLWGLVRSENERKAMRVAAETMPGVNGVNSELKLWPVGVQD